MRPIPPKLRKELAEDSFMETCIHGDESCKGRVEFEHAIMFSGRQVNERWAIVPVCTFHHRGGGLMKDFNKYWAFKRLWESDVDYIIEQSHKYSRAYSRWENEYNYLGDKYKSL